MIYVSSAFASVRSIRLRMRMAKEDERPVRWLYLGRDFRRMQRWDAQLGSRFERIRYDERLQDIALQWRPTYVAWVARLSQENDNLEWWSSRLAERGRERPRSELTSNRTSPGFRVERGNISFMSRPTMRRTISANEAPAVAPSPTDRPSRRTV